MRNHTKGKDVRKVAHTPYGYRIENGRAVIDEEKLKRLGVCIGDTYQAFLYRSQQRLLE